MKLIRSFSNGEDKIFNVKPIITGSWFGEFQDRNIFNTVKISEYCGTGERTEERSDFMKNLPVRNTVKNAMMLFAFCMVFTIFPLTARAEGENQKVTIYGLGSAVQDKISIPDNLPQSYQITAGSGEGTSYRIISGKSAKVSADGLVAPKYTYWKRYPNYSSTVPEGEEYDYYTLESGDTEIEVKTGGSQFILTVSVEDYSITYGNEVMDAYLRDNITDTMTDMEILNAVARFPASYDYSASYSGVYSMVIYGGGDCWASTSAITTLCQKLGIKAWARNGNKDPGAGSGHMNAMAEMNGVYYELEAGYSMDKQDGYRPYDVMVRDSLFSYYITSGSLTIYQYDGMDSTGVLEIPDKIGERTVERIAASAFVRKGFSEIRLPDTLKEIGDFAFSDCSELTRICIPASVTAIGKSVFASCSKLTDLSVSEENANYKEEGQVIYSKDGCTLVTCPVAGEVTIPPAVTKIGDYAFYYNDNLKEIVIPESVTELGEGAFGDCGQLSKVTFAGESLERIGTHCFRSDGQLLNLTIPSSVKTLGAFSFAGCYGLKHIYFLGDAPEFGEVIEGTSYDKVFQGCSLNAYYLKDHVSWTQEAMADHGGTVNWQPWTGTEGISLERAVLTLEQEQYGYTGAYITPAATLTVDGKVLEENKDYTIVYHNNKNVGEAQVTALGIGSYYGEASATFSIGKAKRDLRAYVSARQIQKNETANINYVMLDGVYISLSEVTCISDNPSVATVDSRGVIRGIHAGTAEITLSVEGNENYQAASVTIKITVTDDRDESGGDNPGGGSSGGGNPGGGSSGGSNPGAGGQTGQQTSHYDGKTGCTIVLAADGKKEATLAAVDKKHARGNLRIPDAIKVNNISYKITVIGKNVFQNQKQLKKVTLGKYVRTIGEGAFMGCEKLQAVTIGKNVTVIGNKAFYKCRKLRAVTIPAKVSKIGKQAFCGCKGLKNITIKTKKLTGKNVGARAFKGIYARAVVKAPKSKLSAYKNILKSKGAGAKVRVKK